MTVEDALKHEYLNQLSTNEIDQESGDETAISDEKAESKIAPEANIMNITQARSVTLKANE